MSTTTKLLAMAGTKLGGYLDEALKLGGNVEEPGT